MTVTINAVTGTGLVQSSDGSGVVKLQSNGVATNALAWVNFNGNNGSIRASYNVTSVTRTATGNYTVTFTNALADANYSCVASCSWYAATSRNVVNVMSDRSSGTVAPTTTVVKFEVCNYSSGTAYDSDYMNVVVFGN